MGSVCSSPDANHKADIENPIQKKPTVSQLPTPNQLTAGSKLDSQDRHEIAISSGGSQTNTQSNLGKNLLVFFLVNVRF